MKKYLVTAVVLGSTVAVSSAHAAIDVSSAVEAITGDGVTAITAIGGAMLILAGVAVVFKWSMAAMFGR